MPSELSRLLEAFETKLAPGPPHLDAWVRHHAGDRLPELERMYGLVNGFLAFDGALRVFPAAPATHELSINRWNSLELWRDAYSGLADKLLFFVDEIFGGQFCIQDGLIYAFDPETTALELLAEDLDGWAHAIMSDVDSHTGRPFARGWRAAFGPLEPTQRLAPKCLFMLGGKYELENLHALDAATSMRFRGEAADLLDGAQVRFAVTD